ncbi:transmembrane protein 135-like [Agrilus planipennis]|uniref:Transmembrane protein 135-like n=1 Tax=Agrilus planipennis TaxID=224129 RepID=A0A1W4XIC6_AGRPL|nr:transmembrane protein 135-like [Agrilus planipennis]
MNLISKEEFYKSVTYLTCYELLHPWSKSCVKACLFMSLNTVKGGTKFFIPIYLCKIIINKNKLSKRYLLLQFRCYIRSVIYATLYATFFMTSMCTCRHLCGQFFYYNVAFLGGFFGGASIFIESEFNKTLTTVLWVNLCIETMIRYLEAYGILKPNKLFFGVSFMVSCSLMTHLMMEHDPSKKFLKLWFFTPNTTDLKQMEKVKQCFHKDSCTNYIFQGAYKYFLIGYLVQTLKTVLPRAGIILKQPLLLLQLLFRKNNFMMASFFGSFIAIFRAINCYYSGKKKPEVMGFLASTSYILKHDVTIAITSFTTTLQYLLHPLRQTLEEKYKIPYRELLFMLCNGYLMHARFLHPDQCPQYVINMLKTTTNGAAENVFRNTLKWSTNKEYVKNYFFKIKENALEKFYRKLNF